MDFTRLIRLASLVMLALVVSVSASRADCHDGVKICEESGERISFGRCFKGFPPRCQPCQENRNFRPECSAMNANAGWMYHSPAVMAQPLSMITLPGVHDATMGKVSSCSTYGRDVVAQTQTRSVFQLLNLGVRYFDIRVAIDNSGKLMTAHMDWVGEKYGPVDLRNEGCYGYSLDEVLDDVKRFRDIWPHELVILELSHFKNFKKLDVKESKFDNDDRENLYKAVEGKLPLVKDVDAATALASDMAKLGVLVLIDDSEATPDAKKGFYKRSAIRYAGTFADSNVVDQMANDQLDKLTASVPGDFFSVSWTLTQQKPGDYIRCLSNLLPIPNPLNSACVSILDYAQQANDKLPRLMQAISATGRRPNLILLDNPDFDAIDKIIKVNKATGPNTWRWTECAVEGGECAFSGSAIVRYGLDGKYGYLEATKSVKCDNATFGDPLHGTKKKCWFHATGGQSWQHCADARNTCQLQNSMFVLTRYGRADTKYNYAVEAAPFRCHHDTPGLGPDPAPYKDKTCDVIR